MTTLDLDRARAARAEAQGERHTFIWGGETYTLPPDLPLAFIDQSTTMAQGNPPDIMAMARSLFESDAAWDRFMGTDPPPSATDIIGLVNDVADVYGLGRLGESSASAESSNGTSSR